MVKYVVVGIFIIFDIVTGLLKALKNEGINSTGLREGLYHKASEIIAVVGADLLEYGALYIDLGVDIPVFTIVASYICVMELVSVVENLSILNPALEKLFKPYLQKLRKGDNDDVNH